jgi:hypothetical protein
MADEEWNEEGKVWLEDHGLLDDEQVAQCARADEAEPFRSAVPTRMISNGEYMPIPQTEQQQRVEARVKELAETASKKLGVSRRQFLASSGGMAASLLAMNEVFGRMFQVEPLEMFEPAAYAQAGPPRDLFVFDDQLHFVRGSLPGPLFLRAAATGPSAAGLGFPENPLNRDGKLDESGKTWSVWNPELVGLPLDPRFAHLTNFIKEVFLDSQVTVGLLSNVTASLAQPARNQPHRPLRNVREALQAEAITARQTAAARDFVNSISGSTRMLCHGLLYVGRGNLDYIQEQIEENKPDAWKGYNISNAAKVDTDPNSLMRTWRHDDEDVAYPTFELIQKNAQRLRREKPGLHNICVHKGLAPGPPDPERGHPGDLPKAAHDWPNLNFISYHACIQAYYFHADSLTSIRAGNMRGGVPDIPWTTEYAQLVKDLPNCYAELGTTFASSVVTFPTVTAHLLGQLLRYMGEDRIVFGSDSVWYGSPQWQIEALWRFRIPEALRTRFGYPELTERAKRKILGLNSARLYGISSTKTGTYRPVPKDYESRMSDELKTLMEFGQLKGDNLEKMRETHLALHLPPDIVRYGWIRTSV